MTKALQKLASKLQDRKESNSLRTLKNTEGLVDFFSNDYLGLAHNEELISQIDDAFETLNPKSIGSTGSRLLSGNSTLAEDVEMWLAHYLKADSGLLFNSGYNANIAVLQSIPQRGDTILYDELIHASLKEGARLSFADRYSFRHNDLQHLEERILKSKGEVYVVVESVYSMDGDSCPLVEMIALCEQHGAHLILDEAHSTGIMEEAGKGMAVALGVEEKVFLRVHTFGKGMGCHGAIVLGDQVIHDYLVNFALSFIYTTALPPHSLLSIRAAFLYLSAHPELIADLTAKLALFEQLLDTHVDCIPSQSPIRAIKVAGNERVKQVAECLQEKGFDVRPILSPTVKKGEERLRICLHVFNTEEEIKVLCATINDLLN